MGKIYILLCLACDEVILLVTVINYGVVALNAIVNAKYNKSFLVVCGECILFSFSFLLASALCSSYVWFRLLLFVLVVSYFLFWFVQLLSLGFT